MTDIDWSKAPEGTIGAMVANFNHTKGFGFVEFISSQNDRNFYSEGYTGWIFHDRSFLWNGEGFPPVGTVCEVRHVNFMNWQTYTVIALTREIVIIEEDNGRERAVRKDDYLFRPIKTAEQIALEKRNKAIEEMVYGACGCEPDGGNTTVFMICGFLYDAGYSKGEK